MQSKEINGDQMQAVIVEIGRSIYGVNVFELDEVIPMMEMQSIPNSPDYLRGMINLRGENVICVDLDVVFGEVRRGFSLSSRILVTTIEGRKMGFTVNQVLRIHIIEKENLKPSITQDQGMSYLGSAFSLTPEKICYFIELEKILSGDVISKLFKRQENYDVSTT